LPLIHGASSMHAHPNSFSFDMPQSDWASTSLSAEDEILVKESGINTIISHMASTHRCDKEHVQNLWQRVGDMRQTDLILGMVRRDSEQKLERFLQNFENNMPEVHGEIVLRGHRDSFPQKISTPRIEGIRPRRVSSSTGKLALQIRTGALEDDDEYWPPASSRAGQFVRLERLGRRDEALKMERRRASHGGISPHKVRIVEAGQRSSPILDLTSRLLADTHTRDGIGESHTTKEVGAAEEDDDDGDGDSDIDDDVDVDDDDDDDNDGDDDDDDDDRAEAADRGSPFDRAAHRTESVWGEEEDHILRSGDAEMLKMLSKRVGNPAIRMHL
jgi:hypothetical protein